MSNETIEKLNEIDIETLPLVHGKPRLGPVLKDVPNFYCIGLNYTKHALETGMEIPKEPILFSKATSAIDAFHAAQCASPLQTAMPAAEKAS